MKNKLNDNEVREIAHMQVKIDFFERFIKALRARLVRDSTILSTYGYKWIETNK